MALMATYTGLNAFVKLTLTNRRARNKQLAFKLNCCSKDLTLDITEGVITSVNNKISFFSSIIK